jgi:hypothetical protein
MEKKFFFFFLKLRKINLSRNKNKKKFRIFQKIIQINSSIFLFFKNFSKNYFFLSNYKKKNKIIVNFFFHK